MKTRSGEWQDPYLKERNRRNFVFEDFVNLELNPWATWETLPEPIRLLVNLNNQEYAFRDRNHIIGDE